MTAKDAPREIVMRRLDALVLSDRNARIHDKRQVDKIAASMREFGWTVPVLIDATDTIIAGHGRVMAAKALGIEEAPCIQITHLTPSQIKAYRIADNKLALDAEWDFDMLRVELADLGADLFDLSLTGFAGIELAALQGDEAAASWAGMPEYVQGDERAAQRIVVHFVSKADVAAFAKLIGKPLTESTRFLWFPEEPPINAVADKRYASSKA